MRTRIVKKNNKELVARKGSGFRGRVLPVQFGNSYVVLNNLNKRPRTEAIIRYCDAELTDENIATLQRFHLKRYKCELLRLNSHSQFIGSVHDGKCFTRELEPIGNQINISFLEDLQNL